MTEHRGGNEDSQDRIGAQQFPCAENQESEWNQETKIGALLHQPMAADQDEQPAQNETGHRTEGRGADESAEDLTQAFDGFCGAAV